MSHEVEIIAAINLAGADVKYSKPFLNKVFVSNDECNLKETELSLEADFIERDVAETIYNTNQEHINCTKLKMRILESQIQREWGGGNES